MAARTTASNGVISNATGTNLDGGTALGTTDTLTSSHVNDVDANSQCGSSPATGGTAAIQFASVNTKSLTVDAGITLTCKGDFKFANNDTQKENKLILAAGSQFVLLPPSAQQYKFDCQVNAHIDCNGSSGSRVTVKTDKSSSGLAAYTLIGGYTVGGFHTCTYTDFIDLGDATHFGVQANRARGGVNYPDANSHLTITDSTFTRSSFKGTFCGGGWDGNLTFQGNTFDSSTVIDLGGGLTNVCAQFAFADDGTNGTWLIDTNGFDGYVAISFYRARIAFTNNVAQGVWYFAGGWSTSEKFSGNIITAPSDHNLLGPTTDNYWYCPSTNNPHTLAVNGSNISELKDSVFEAAATVGNGDILVYQGSVSGVIEASGNLVLAKNNCAAGKLLSLATTGSVAFTCNHNTFVGQSEHGLIGLSETANSYAGQIAACNSNLVVSSVATTDVYVIRQSGAGTIATDTVTLADYNATLNASTGTCKYNTSTSQAGVVGYSGIEVSNASAYPNSQIGQHDLTISANPFFDSTRNLSKWSAFKGQAETDAAGIAYAVANPVAATDATTGLLAWVRAGFQVTGSQGLLLKDAGHDAATIGAMGYEASGGGSTAATLLAIGVI